MKTVTSSSELVLESSNRMLESQTPVEEKLRIGERRNKDEKAIYWKRSFERLTEQTNICPRGEQATSSGEKEKALYPTNLKLLARRKIQLVEGCSDHL